MDIKDKIEIFDYIDKAIEVVEGQRESITKAALRVNTFLDKSFFCEDEVVGVTYRVKTANSLKEKIIRNGLFNLHDSIELVHGVSDIIGVRIECRFLDDEQTVYEKLKKMFCCTDDNEYFYPEGKKGIMLKLSSPQPEHQKNGLEIYRLDGVVMRHGEKYNFELQIKSLVNSFWSEIEHKIIYKNKRHMMINEFVSELMTAIHQNLVNIDRQLNMLLRRCQDSSVVEKRDQVENLIIVFINDLYSRIIESKVGFSINIKPYSESLVKYIVGFSSFSKSGTDYDEGVLYGETMFNVMHWLKAVDFEVIEIGRKIQFENTIRYDSDLQCQIGQKFMSVINEDFYVNTFFHILFSLEVGNDAQDFMSYVRYYEHRLLSSGADKERLLQCVIMRDPAKMLLENDIAELIDTGKIQNDQ